MKKHQYLTLALSAAIALSPLAVIRAASLIGLSYGPSLDQNLRGSANVDVRGVGLDSGSNASAEGNASTELHGNISVDRADLDREGAGIPNTGLDTSLNLDENASGRGHASSSAATSTSSGANAALHASESAFAHANENSAIFKMADRVATEADLRAFALSSLRSDGNLNTVTFGNDNIVVTYNDHGRLIGIIPMTMPVTVTVDQSGNVTIDYPWYAFLVAKDRADLEARVDAAVAGNANASTTIGWTNYDRAELAARVLAALEAHFNASSTASSTAER